MCHFFNSKEFLSGQDLHTLGEFVDSVEIHEDRRVCGWFKRCISRLTEALGEFLVRGPTLQPKPTHFKKEAFDVDAPWMGACDHLFGHGFSLFCPSWWRVRAFVDSGHVLILLHERNSFFSRITHKGSFLRRSWILSRWIWILEGPTCVKNSRSSHNTGIVSNIKHEL